MRKTRRLGSSFRRELQGKGRPVVYFGMVQPFVGIGTERLPACGYFGGPEFNLSHIISRLKQPGIPLLLVGWRFVSCFDSHLFGC
jgi:hypothetical protein